MNNRQIDSEIKRLRDEIAHLSGIILGNADEATANETKDGTPAPVLYLNKTAIQRL